MVVESEGGINNTIANPVESDDHNERDKLVQFDMPETSQNAQKYFSNVSANIRK